MAQWVRLCGVAETPEAGKVREAEVRGMMLCLGNVGGTLHAVDNLCPHRRAPLGEGWIEDGKLVCPWHSWTFDMATGKAEYPEDETIEVFPLKVEGEDVLVDLEGWLPDVEYASPGRLID